MLHSHFTLSRSFLGTKREPKNGINGTILWRISEFADAGEHRIGAESGAFMGSRLPPHHLRSGVDLRTPRVQSATRLPPLNPSFNRKWGADGRTQGAMPLFWNLFCAGPLWGGNWRSFSPSDKRRFPTHHTCLGPTRAQRISLFSLLERVTPCVRTWLSQKNEVFRV